MYKALIGKTVKAGLVFVLMGSTSALAQNGGWKLSEMSGQVSVGRQGVTKTAFGGQKLRAGDVIRTGSRGRAVVTRGDQYMVVAANSHIKLANPETDGVLTQVFNYLGNVLFKVDKRKTKHFGVETPYMAAVVKGTTFNVTVGAEGSTVQVTEGAVEVATLDGGAVELLRPGMIGMVAGADPFAMTIMGDGTRRIESPNRQSTIPGATKRRTTVSTASRGKTSKQAPVLISQTISNQPVQLAAITNGLIEGNSPGSPQLRLGLPSSENNTQQDVLLATENVVSQILENSAASFDAGRGNSGGQNTGNSGQDNGSAIGNEDPVIDDDGGNEPADQSLGDPGQSEGNVENNGASGNGDDDNNGHGNDPGGQDPSNPGQGNDSGDGNDNGTDSGQGNGNAGGNDNEANNSQDSGNAGDNGASDNADDGNNGHGNDPGGQDSSNPGQGNGSGANKGQGNGNGSAGDNGASGNGDDGNNGHGNDPGGQDPGNPGQGNGNGNGADNGQMGDNSAGSEESSAGSQRNGSNFWQRLREFGEYLKERYFADD